MSVSTRAAPERAWVEVNLANLVANARRLLVAARGASLLPMVKADGYGLGAVACAKALEAVDPWGFGVATVDEGLALRAAGIRRPVVVFTPARLDQLQRYRDGDLRAVVDDPSVAGQWPLPFHVEVDTGMARCGARWDDAAALKALGAAGPEGVFTHFHSADHDAASVAAQLERFGAAQKALGSRPAVVHAANSAGIFRMEAAGVEPLDVVRPGIFLYGGTPGAGLPEPQPVAAVRARVVDVRRVAAGETVSYGATWRAASAATVATLSFGYADGYARAASGRGTVVVRGVRCPLVGRVTMDFVMADVTAARGASVGDVATLLGEDASAVVTLEEWAAAAGTISYEVLARLGSRLERVYVS